MVKNPPVVFVCNGASGPKKLIRKSKHVRILEYREGLQGQNIKLSLPDFVRGVYHLPDRILDLLELAAYVFSADRLQLRGHKDDLEYQSWPRSLHFVVRVRDFDFWSRPTVRTKLIEALRFMSGDDEYDFTFQKGHSTPKTSLFDSEEFKVDRSAETRIVLFSGGLDSLTGVIDSLETLSSRLCLVSHQSQPGTIRTQDQLSAALANIYRGRIAHYKFHCTLKEIRATEETQRTRAFLYSAIAYSLATAFSQSRFSVYENGFTAINFPRRQDLMNARASRTTHPKTMALLQDFFASFMKSRSRLKLLICGRPRPMLLAESRS